MRQKKIRGHKRRHKQIDKWKRENLSIDLNDYLLNANNRCYTKIRIHPWSGISVTKSTIPQPARKTRQIMLGVLLNIYENWKHQLNTIGQPYYLKIWIFEPRFAQSQVVCAIGDRIDFYENTFFKPAESKIINLNTFGSERIKAEKFGWEYCLDEDHYDNGELAAPEHYTSKQDYDEAKAWFEKLLKKPHRMKKFAQPIGEATESYSFKRGCVWVGGHI